MLTLHGAGAAFEGSVGRTSELKCADRAFGPSICSREHMQERRAPIGDILWRVRNLARKTSGISKTEYQASLPSGLRSLRLMSCSLSARFRRAWIRMADAVVRGVGFGCVIKEYLFAAYNVRGDLRCHALAGVRLMTGYSAASARGWGPMTDWYGVVMNKVKVGDRIA